MRESSTTPDALSNAATVLGGLAMACMACATWRAVDTAITQNSDVLAAQHRHHEELVHSIQSLAEQTGILTSADLCPVRFRFRRVDGFTVPLTSPDAALEVEADGEYQHMWSKAATTAGTVDFGLVAPGRYRVTVRLNDGMHLRHEFDVLPGVPVDRLITCPNQSAPSHDMELDIDWPDALAGTRLLAVCSIEPAGCTQGDWVWRPSDETALVCVLAVNPGDEVSPVDLSRASQWITGTMPAGLQPASAFSTSFRYCQLTEILFLLQTGIGPEFVVLGTGVFAQDLETADPGSADAAVWHSATPPPLIELQYAENRWSIPLPDDLVSCIAARIREIDAEEERVPRFGDL